MAQVAIDSHEDKTQPTLIDHTKSNSHTAPQVMHEILKYQKSTDLLIPALPFKKLTRDLIDDIMLNDLQLKDVTKVKIQADALEGIQAHIEDYMVKLMIRANASAIHAHRITVQPKDIKLVKFVQSEN